MHTIRVSGDFSNIEKFLSESGKREVRVAKILDACGARGVELLSAKTPVDTGFTANSWSYKIRRTANGSVIQWYNAKVNDGIPIAILLQYGHATRDGAWIEGQDFVNPAIDYLIGLLTNELWEATG